MLDGGRGSCLNRQHRCHQPLDRSRGDKVHVFSAASVESTLKANETLENQLNARLRRGCREGPSLGGSTVGIAGWQSHSATVIAADTRRRSNAERISVRYVRLP